MQEARRLVFGSGRAVASLLLAMALSACGGLSDADRAACQAEKDTWATPITSDTDARMRVERAAAAARLADSPELRRAGNDLKYAGGAASLEAANFMTQFCKKHGGPVN